PLHEISHLYLLDFTGPPGFAQQRSASLSKLNSHAAA
ncbi:unnamed protein product, partial [Brassica oleracea var. botrytis]